MYADTIAASELSSAPASDRMAGSAGSTIVSVNGVRMEILAAMRRILRFSERLCKEKMDTGDAASTGGVKGGATASI
jgi:hypothetical protein